MNLNDSKTINADRETVWAALLNSEVLMDCVPGCQEMSGNAEDGFEAVVVQKVGPVKATFKGAVTFSDMNKPDSLTMSGEGKGGAAGFAKGGAVVRLEESGDQTILHYDVEAKVGGKLAQLGSRIIGGFAKKMADQFFVKFQEIVGAPEAEEAVAEAPAPAAEDAPAEKKGWFKRTFSK